MTGGLQMFGVDGRQDDTLNACQRGRSVATPPVDGDPVPPGGQPAGKLLGKGFKAAVTGRYAPCAENGQG